jgi:hypothetical protein
MADLVRESQDACAAALRAYGFTPKRRGLLLQPGTKKIATGWLGLNLATVGLPAKLQVNPVVGVRHIPLEAALVELAGWKPPVASISRPLGYLMPQNTFAQWDFVLGDDLTSVAADLARTVAEFGQPFIDRWSDWKRFSSDVGDSGLLLDLERYIVLPIVAALNGERAAADDLVQQELARTGGSEDAYAKAYRAFAEKFSKKSFG